MKRIGDKGQRWSNTHWEQFRLIASYGLIEWLEATGQTPHTPEAPPREHFEGL